MSNYSLFSVLGIEIEYMLVDKDSFEVAALSDKILHALAGKQCNEVSLGDIAVSNELVMHVLELKNDGPRKPDPKIREDFQQALLQLQSVLNQEHLMLLPGGAHPWMNPLNETKRWPHGNKAIYQQYDTIFNCQGHGWANLQSMHVNLPFANDDEFCQLHNSIRLLLPLLPALAASTPFLDGKHHGLLDTRLDFYEKNQKKIPSISGQIIPEFIRSESQYQDEILTPMYQDIRPYDPKGILQYEWLNSRGAIPKFDVKAIEIRIIDSQESVKADIAIALTCHALLKSWLEQSHYHLEKPCETSRLKALYDRAIKEGFQVTVDDTEILSQWQLPKRTMTLRDAWSMLIERISPQLDQISQCALEHILSQGNLSERLLKACRGELNKAKLKTIYRQLSDCLINNESFSAL